MNLHRSKKFRLPINVGVVGMLMLTTAWASSPSFTSGYKAESSKLPVEMDGTVADPIWEVSLEGAGSEATVDGGILNVSTVHAGGNNTLLWRLGRDANGISFGEPAGAWAAQAEQGSTLEFRIMVTDEVDKLDHGVERRGGFALTASDGRYEIILFFGPTGVSAIGKGISANESCDSKEMRTYRLAMKDGRATLYGEGEDAAILSDLPMVESDSNAITFGDISGYVSGAFGLEYLSWTNQGAQLSAPPGKVGTSVR